MLHARGDLVDLLQTSTTNMVVVLVVEHENQLTEVHGNLRAPQDRGRCSRCSPRRRLPSATAVVSSITVVSMTGASVQMRNLVHTAVLSSTVITPQMGFLQTPHSRAVAWDHRAGIRPAGRGWQNGRPCGRRPQA